LASAGGAVLRLVSAVPKRIVLDIDDTFDRVRGARQPRLFGPGAAMQRFMRQFLQSEETFSKLEARFSQDEIVIFT
jgi:hypothetical protein